MKLAFLFPGQGSQVVGMGQALAASFPEARAVFDEADRVLGFPLVRTMWEGPEQALRATENAQPALLVHSVAALRVVESRGLVPAFAAGHSLGEYGAHVAAGSLAFEDALRLVRRRGELMAEAGRAQSGTMAAILGLDGALVEEACAEVREAGGGTVVAANYNAPGQVVISGEIAAVETAMVACRERGAKRAIRLPVSGAFHSPLMGPATEGLLEALGKVPVHDATLPVIANVDARPVSDAAAIRDRLGRQLLGAVRWEESMRFIASQGTGAFVELGSGRVLRGLVRQIVPEAKSANLDDPAGLDETLALLGAGAGA